MYIYSVISKSHTHARTYSIPSLTFLGYSCGLDVGHIGASAYLTHTQTGEDVSGNRGSKKLSFKLVSAKPGQSWNRHVCVCVCVLGGARYYIKVVDQHNNLLHAHIVTKISPRTPKVYRSQKIYSGHIPHVGSVS